MTDKRVVLITCGSRGEARAIALALVEERLAACVNVTGTPVRSIYRWKGHVEEAEEILLLAKTSKSRLKAMVRRLQELHSYESPEIVALPIAEGLAGYLDWVEEAVDPSKTAGEGTVPAEPQTAREAEAKPRGKLRAKVETKPQSKRTRDRRKKTRPKPPEKTKKQAKKTVLTRLLSL